MNTYVVYYTPNTGAGYFLTGDKEAGFGGTYRLSEAAEFKSKAAAVEVARNYGAAGTECNVLRKTGESI